MAMSYFDLLEWLAAPTEKAKAEVWLRANPVPPPNKFQLYLGKPYKPQIVMLCLEAFIWDGIRSHKDGWQQTRYPLEKDIKEFWRSPLGQIYLIWFNFVSFFCTFGRRLDVFEWRLGFEKRMFIKRSFPGRR